MDSVEPTGKPPARRARSLMRRRKPQKVDPAGRPGIAIADLESMPEPARRVPITCIDYSPEKVETRHITDLEQFIQSRRPPWVRVRWINVDGLSDPATIRALAIKYGLHPLAIEDVMTIDLAPERLRQETC